MEIYQGNFGDPIKFKLLDDDMSVADVEDYDSNTITFKLKESDFFVSGVATIADGYASYTPLSGDFDILGLYFVYIDFFREDEGEVVAEKTYTGKLEVISKC
jgi:hypothetical protein